MLCTNTQSVKHEDIVFEKISLFHPEIFFFGGKHNTTPVYNPIYPKYYGTLDQLPSAP